MGRIEQVLVTGATGYAGGRLVARLLEADCRARCLVRDPQLDGRTLLVQTAFFAPKGLGGFLYWYLLLPFHRLIFAGMICRLAQLAET